MCGAQSALVTSVSLKLELLSGLGWEMLKLCKNALWTHSREQTELCVPMDVAESPERDPRSPEDEEEEHQGLSEDDILRESGSDQDLDKAAGKASDLEDEENAVLGLSQEEEESRSDEEDQDQDSEPQELNRGPTSPPHAEEGDGGEEDRTSDLRDEASSVTRELDEHELDYDEEVPEEPAPAGQEDEAEKAGAEDDEEKGEGAPEEKGKVDVHSVEEKEPLEAAKEKKKEDDDGEIDDGEIDDDDLEEGEVKDPSDRKVRPRPTCRFFMKACMCHLKFTRASCTSFPDVVTPLSTLLPPISNSIPFRDQVKGNCTWGMNCRFIHPGVNDKGNYSLITKAEPFPPNGAPPLGPHPLMPANPWGGPVVDEILPPPPPEPPTESAWERGLRHAKEVLKKATIRKEQEPDFEEKRFTVTIGEDEREFDKENEVFRDWNYRITRDVRDTVRQAEPPKKEAVSTGPQVKRADEWKDPWRRSKSPKKKLGVSVSPSRARRRRKTSASSASASNSSRSSSRSSSYSGSGSSRSRSRSSSYSSYSSRSSRHSSFSGSRSRSRSFSSSPSPSPTPSPHRPVRTKGEPALPPGKAGEKMVKKPAPPPAPPQAPKTAAPTPEPAKPGDPREARRRERQARTPPRRRTISGSGSGSSYSGSSSRSRSLSVSSVSSVSSATSSSSSVHTVDSDDMYADLASPVSSASSRSPTPAQTKKEKAGKSKKEDGVKEDKRKRDSSTQPPKSSKSSTGNKSSQQPTAPQQAPSGQPQQGAFVAHKEIKLTLLNKAADKGSRKRYEPSDKDRLSPPPAKRANLSPDRGSRDRKSGGRLGSPKPERQRGQNSKAPVALPDRKRQLSPQSKSSSKVTSVPGKASDAGAGTAASAGTKSGKASTLSRREELLKQLKAVEDAIARKRAKIPGKV
ncbi:zinc finger CCCH domain-containing protein 18 isoform X9 [Pipistrellus kuhlii]|uniref:zinc finger CCCH domain-containing protein 18 isoform X9 n=1 Tax=Pipistrellus kuhlii TaxID=59472 RepID=UPI001E26F02E|nr:zinc finger CCCH domain-containing protein 18 isoform X9 [Pipistrellus kuhlii]